MDGNIKSTKKSKSSLQSQHSLNILNLSSSKKSKGLTKIVIAENLPAIREQTELMLKTNEEAKIHKRNSPLTMSTSRLELNKVNLHTKLPKLSKSYKSIIKSQQNSNSISKKNLGSTTFESTDNEDLESHKKSKKLTLPKIGASPTKVERVSSNTSSQSNRSQPKPIKKKVSVQLLPPTIKKDVTDTEEAELEEFEPYEEFMKRAERESNLQNLQTQAPSPVTDSIWPSEWFEVPKKKVDPLEKLNLRIGSIFSEDANYAMLKTYEDMIYYDLVSIYPESKVNSLERMKTEIFKRVPRKFSSKNNPALKLPEVHKSKVMPNSIKENSSIKLNKNSDTDNHQLHKHKYTVSRQLETAMKLSDVVKKAKGHFVPCADRLKTKNPLIEYNHWKNNWNNYILNN